MARQWLGTTAVAIILTGVPLGTLLGLPACGVLNTPETGNGGDGGGSYLSWAQNDNGTAVLDANGNRFGFDAITGCMYLESTGIGPQGFCLTSTSAPANTATGPTNCITPSMNTVCNVAGFEVVLTPDPANHTGCIAVLSTAQSTTVGDAIRTLPLSVAISGNNVAITSSASATAYTVYAGLSGGTVPICGGSNPYAGSYAGTIPANTSAYCGLINGEFEPPSTPSCSISFTVDSGGNIYYLASSGPPSMGFGSIEGTIASNGMGTFYSWWTTTNLGTYQATEPINSAAKNSSGKWVLEMPGFSMVQQ